MTTLPERVNPGDLITADLMNHVLESLKSVDERLAALESIGPGGGTVIITGLVPSGPVALGSTLRIAGRNFGLPGTNVVTIDNIQVATTAPGNSDNLLIVSVPLLQGVPAVGKTVTLTVSNPKGFASTSLVVVPAQPTVPTGSLSIRLSQAPPDLQLLAGQSYAFVFTVKAITSLQDVYTLTPSVDTGWPAIIVDATSIEMTPAEIVIPKSDPPQGTSRDVRVRVTIPAGTPTATTAKVKLTVRARSNPTGLVGMSSGDQITVGAAPPPAQSIPIRLSAVINSVGAPAPTVDLVNQSVTIPTVGVTYRVDLAAEINDPAFVPPDPITGAPRTSYNVALTDPGNNWTAKISGGQTALAALLSPTEANSSNLIKILLTANAGATPSALAVRVQKATDPAFFGVGSVGINTSP